jgi:hypothetical protein
MFFCIALSLSLSPPSSVDTRTMQGAVAATSSKPKKVEPTSSAGGDGKSTGREEFKNDLQLSEGGKHTLSAI